jgi:Domain of unknown function (DUF3535).
MDFETVCGPVIYCYVMKYVSYLLQAQKQNRIQRRGASFALTAISIYFGRDMPQKLPKLWEIMIGYLKDTVDLNTFGELLEQNIV